MKRLIIAVIVILALAGIGYGGYYGWTNEWAPCAKHKVDNALGDITAITSRFETADKIASKTAMIALGPQVSQMGVMLEDVKAVKVPACMMSYQTNIADSMQWEITGYTSFMAQENDTAVNASFLKAERSMLMAMEDLDKVKKCVPFCK
jgi:hypothetical protein